MLFIYILCLFVSHPYFVCDKSDTEKGSFMIFLQSPVFEEHIFPQELKYVQRLKLNYAENKISRKTFSFSL